MLTIAGISTVFTLVNGVLLTPLPYPDSSRFVSITQHEPFGPPGAASASAADVVDVRNDSRTLERTPRP